MNIRYIINLIIFDNNMGIKNTTLNGNLIIFHINLNTFIHQFILLTLI